MPGKGGIEALPDVLQAVPDAKVPAPSMHDDPQYVREAFEAGARGYVRREAADTEVVDAVRTVAAGERYVHPALGARLVAAEVEERKRWGDAGPAFRPGTRSATPSCARPYQPGDRLPALHLRPYGGDASGPHHAEARSLEQGGSSSATRSTRV